MRQYELLKQRMQQHPRHCVVNVAYGVGIRDMQAELAVKWNAYVVAPPLTRAHYHERGVARNRTVGLLQQVPTTCDAVVMELRTASDTTLAQLQQRVAQWTRCSIRIHCVPPEQIMQMMAFTRTYQLMIIRGLMGSAMTRQIDKKPMARCIPTFENWLICMTCRVLNPYCTCQKERHLISDRGALSRELLMEVIRKTR